MGGMGSGRPRLSDEEKKRRGTYRPSNEKKLEERRVAKVIAGPWLTSIPEPEYVLNDVGRAKYDELTGELFDQRKLTKITVTLASVAALMHQKFADMAENGKYPSANDVSKFQSALRELNIASHAKVTAAPGQKNRFAGSGFSNSRTSPIRLRVAGSGTGEL